MEDLSTCEQHLKEFNNGCEGCSFFRTGVCVMNWSKQYLPKCPCKTCLVKTCCNVYCNELSDYYYSELTEKPHGTIPDNLSVGM
jgi:hypothetical protein